VSETKKTTKSSGTQKRVPASQEKSVEQISAEMREKYAIAFAKAVAQQTIHDPSGKTSRRTSRAYSTYTRENIEEWLKSPTSREEPSRCQRLYVSGKSAL